MTAKQAALTHRLEEQKSKLSVLREQYEKMGSEYQQNKEKHEQLIASYDREKSELERAENAAEVARAPVVAEDRLETLLTA